MIRLRVVAVRQENSSKLVIRCVDIRETFSLTFVVCSFVLSLRVHVITATSPASCGAVVFGVMDKAINSSLKESGFDCGMYDETDD